MVLSSFSVYIVMSVFVYTATGDKLDPSVYFPDNAEDIKSVLQDPNTYIIKDWSQPPATVKYPNQARIFLNDNNGTYMATICVIVNPQFCLTLASSTNGYTDNPSPFKIIAFDDSLSESQGITYEVKNVVYAPNYSSVSSDDYDLAIVEVKQLFKYTVFSFIGDELTLNSPAASSLYAVAHGIYSDSKEDIVFSKMPVKLIDNSTCANMTQDTTDIYSDMICTISPDADANTPCYLDYGAGLYSDTSATQGAVSPFNVVYALVEDVDCFSSGVTFYTYLQPYKSWIIKNTKMINRWWEQSH